MKWILSLFGLVKLIMLAVGIAGCLRCATPADAAEPPRPERNIDGIMDNSFLVEEAYNQEPGVVQHIFTAAYGVDRLNGPDDRTWNLAFTQEWPLWSQDHQFSYTIPYSFTRSGGVGDDGVGDVMLNYRYQVFLDEKTLRAFAPRFSLVLPTGDEQRGFGSGTVGYQVNLPFSTAIGDQWFVHLNAGVTALPSAGPAPTHDLWHYNLGASAIWAATHDCHLLLEWVGVWNHVPNGSGGLQHEFATVISPGVRKAFNFSGESQLVVGVACPIGLSGAAADFGAFLYFSFEHAFARKH